MADQVAPRTLEDLRRVKGDEEIIRAAGAYIELGEQKIREARLMRDAAVRRLAETYGPAEAARRAGMSLSTVKLARGRR